VNHPLQKHQAGIGEDMRHTTSFSNTERELGICENLGISQDAFHSLQLQLRGVCVDRKDIDFRKDDVINFKEIHLRLLSNEANGYFSVPKKIPIMPKGASPYEYVGNKICYHGRPVFGGNSIVEVPLPEAETPRYLKGYSFPFLGTKYPYYELRINPKNTGACPGRCLFCHRGFSHRFRPQQTERLLSPEKVVDRIIRDYGTDVFKGVSHVSVITELFGSEAPFLRYLGRLKELLARAGVGSKMKFGACAQDVRSEEGLRNLYEIVDEKRYSYTLEVFSNRTQIMSKYKALPLTAIETLLERARNVGFDELKLNYIAGIDSFTSFEKGLLRLHRLGLVDTIGLSIFAAFFADQLSLRNQEAWRIEYYYKVIQLIKELGISLYKPNCFEMGYPLQFL